MSFDDHQYPNGGVFSAIPLGVDSDTGSSKSLLSNPSSNISKKYHSSSRQQESHNVSGFLFGLRSGFASHLLLGLLIVLAFSDQVQSAASDDYLVGVAFMTVAWIIATITTAVLSSKVYFWINQLQQPTAQDHPQTADQEFHLYHGSIIGMFFAWILFDLLLETGLVVLAVHLGVALAGHCYIRSARELFLNNRRSNRVIIISDDLLKSLDLA